MSHEIRSPAASKNHFPSPPSFQLHSLSWLCRRLICLFWMLDLAENCWYNADEVKYKATSQMSQGLNRTTWNDQKQEKCIQQ